MLNGTAASIVRRGNVHATGEPMLGLEDATAWTVVGTSGFAALLVLLTILMLVRWRRTSSRRLALIEDSVFHAERLLSGLAETRETTESEPHSKREAGRLQVLAELGSTLDLETVAKGALEHVAEAVAADGAATVLQGDEEKPFSASFGLSPAESERELIGFLPDMNDARAATIRYRYSAEEVENDAFRLTSGLAVPLEAEGSRIGTLAVFWRRREDEPGDDEVVRVEEVAATVSGPLESARRFDEARRLADIDALTGLQNERYFVDRLHREVARAHRYERRVSLLLLRTATDEAPLVAVGRRLRAAVRSADVACHLGEGGFAVILPEVGIDEADHLCRRLRFAVGAGVGDSTERELPATTAELQPDESADSLLQRAAEALRLVSEKPDATPAAPAETGG
jgi:diguanylate cyclase (GGDEF)-like protein